MKQRIVLMPPNWLGDVVLAQPALRALSAFYQEADIEVFGRSWLNDLLPFLNLQHPSMRYVQDISKHSDAVFLFPNSLRSALQAFAARGKKRVGFRREGRGVFLTHAYTSTVDLISEHHRGYYLDMLQQFGVPTPYLDVELSVPEEELKCAQALLVAQGINVQRFICVAPGAQFGGAKRYPAESYAAVLKRISADGWDIVVLGTPAERDIATQCLAQVSGHYWNASGQTSLRQALQIVGATALTLCNDSGLMHVAAGFGIPTVTMFGATDPNRTSPSGVRTHVLYHPAACSPCLQRECNVFGHPCMANILPEHVYEACKRYLGS